jgi:hypothetical protein
VTLALPVAVTPSGSATSSPAPFENQTGGGHSGAGSLAFLVILGLIAVSIFLFWAMNQSFKRVRRNLGGDPLGRGRPSRPRPMIPGREDEPL